MEDESEQPVHDPRHHAHHEEVDERLGEIHRFLVLALGPREVVEKAPRERQNEHHRYRVEEQPELAIRSEIGLAERANVDDGYKEKRHKRNEASEGENADLVTERALH